MTRWTSAIATLLFTLMISRGRPGSLLARAGFSDDFYDVQAAAFLQGRLDVPAEVAGLEGFLIDGKTYLYFGPFLALVRVPFALFGTIFEGRLTRISMIVAFALLCMVVVRLAVSARRMLGIAPDSFGRWRLVVLIAVVVSSPVLALSGQANVYNETELWALVLMLTTFHFGLLVAQSPTTKHAAIMCLAAFATVLTRASIGFGALTVAIGVGFLVWRRSRVLAGTLWGSSVLALVSHMFIHRAKFGHLLNLPAERQVLTLNDPARAAWFAANDNSFFDVSFIPTTVLHYLRPDAIAFERLFPFIRFGKPAVELTGELETYTPSSSLTVAASALVIFGLLGLGVVVRRRLSFFFPMILGGLVAAGPTLSIGFIAHRYLVDLLPVPILLATVAVVAGGAKHSRSATVGASILVAWGLWVNLALAMWLGVVTSLGFTEFRYRLDDVLHSSPAPSVRTVDQHVPRDGIVGIEGDCNGLYISTEGRWLALELADGTRRLTGVFDPRRGGVALEGALGEQLRIEATDNGHIVATYAVDDTNLVEGDPVGWSGETVTLDVLSDPISGWVTRGLRVWVDGRLALSSLEAPELSRFAATDAFKVTLRKDEGTPVCKSISRRRSIVEQ